EIRRQKLAPRQDSGLSLFSTRVGGVLARPAVTVGVGTSLRRAAEIMVREKVGSLLVLGEDGRLAGIVTDTDFRRKVVAMGRDAGSPIAEIMSSPVLSIGSEASCFEALLTMMRRQIHHLAVRGPSGTEGMVTSHDIMVLQGSSPYSLFREIAAEGSYRGLYELSARIPLAVRSLMEQGAKADNITRLMAALNDLVLERLLRLMQRELGPPPAPFCWLLMGSEGRREQTFRTDQDNALVYRDAEDPGVREYFLRFGEQAIEHLVACGFPRCKGDIMASNPKWCQPWSVWREYFDSWISQPEPSEVMHSTIFFDFRPGFGDADLAETLKAGVLKRTAREDVFLRHLAADCLKTRPPLSFFRGFIVEKDGEHKNTLDIKTRGLVPFVDFARLMCLKHGLAETNTLARYRLLEQAGRISGELCREIKDAYEFLMQIRLAHQLRQMEDGLAPDNRVDPARLTELEKRTLKDAFSVMVKVQAFIKDSFRLNV
ncbi:MAG: DUF294 nucleotidyltransferase-like domain-containing protein, partial [Desulfovibrionaceae bacterium]|nr:DUF294 nucleotidyltransferase-like domain-containing protein [Desulfovibrionaceae bacterium]